jgi:heat shock protein HtpX
MKINGTMQRIPEQDLRANSELAAFYIARPSTKSLFNLFSTHPPMEKRVEALSRLEAQIQGTTATTLAA